MRSCKWRWRRVVFAGEGKKTGMIYIFGPYAAGKREYVRETFGYTEADFSTKAEDNCRVLYDAQQLASKVGNRPEELEKLAEQLCRKRSRHRNGNRVRCRADRCCRTGGKRSSRTAVDSACKTGAESHSCLVRPAGKPSITDVWTGRQQGRCGRNERKIWSRR